ncbi:MAG TPA: TetR family transcriptional regulator [Acidimicrobiia bacterium]|nr:TetR family transcriptional regulator [Acidimicrobiia bacterium]
MNRANATQGAAPRQDRSRARRDALLRAAIELLGETGVKSVTHRAVAERAGVPLASTTYYFRSVRELVEEALKLHVAERVAELESLVDVALHAAGASVTQLAERMAAVLVAAPTPTLVAQYQMYLEAGRNPALQPAATEALAAFEGLIARVLSALGARQPQAAAEAFFALFDGFALHRLARPRDPDTEAAALFVAMRALFLEQVMDPATRDELHDQLRRPLASP